VQPPWSRSSPSFTRSTIETDPAIRNEARLSQGLSCTVNQLAAHVVGAAYNLFKTPDSSQRAGTGNRHDAPLAELRASDECDEMLLLRYTPPGSRTGVVRGEIPRPAWALPDPPHESLARDPVAEPPPGGEPTPRSRTAAQRAKLHRQSGTTAHGRRGTKSRGSFPSRCPMERRRRRRHRRPLLTCRMSTSRPPHAATR
jgi:hypothetical protein